MKTLRPGSELIKIDVSTEESTLRYSKNHARPKLLSPHGKTVALWGTAVLGLVVRLVACLQNPATALDLERMLYWGLAMNQHGTSAASVPLKHWGVPSGVAWRDLPANYPVIGLMFFRAVAGIIPTVTFGKLVLTGIEALNGIRQFGPCIPGTLDDAGRITSLQGDA